jgi:hypothetical protein
VPDSFTGEDGADSRSPVAATAPTKPPAAIEASRHKADHGFTPEREAAALTFVRQHHPELAKLLATLKTKEKQEYFRAVRDLFRASERLATYREKYPERYDAELKAWQIKSHIQLVATRLKLSPEDARLREQLRSALVEQVDLRIQLLRQERQKMADRLKRLDDQIDEMQSHREDLADKQLQMFVRTVQKKPPPKRNPLETVKETGKRPPKAKDNNTARPKAIGPAPPPPPDNR